MYAVERRQAWLETVAEYRASGMSVAAWCRENPHVKERQLRTWLQRIPPEESLPVMAMQWLEVHVEEARPVEQSGGEENLRRNDTETDGSCLTVRVGRVAIEVGRGFDRELLADVVEALSKRC